MTPSMQCDTCRFWSKNTDPGWGACRRRPPQVSFEASNCRGVWPETHMSDGCGEHAPLAEELPTPVESLSVASIQPHDVLVVQHPGHISEDAVCRIRDGLKRVWPNNESIIIGDGLTLKVAKVHQGTYA